LYYREAGSGFPVVLIHGLGSDHTGWNRYVDVLSSKYRCITFDNRDAGKSARVPSSYSIRDMAADTMSLLDEIGVPSAHIVGFSLGAAVAQELVLARPDYARSLVLISAYTSSDPRGEALFNSWKLLKTALSPEDYARTTLPWVYTHHEYRLPGLIDRVVRAATQDASSDEAEAFARQVDATLSFFSEDRLATIAAPTLIIAAADDLLAPLRFARTLHELVPNARLEIIPDCGHGVLWTRTSEVLDLLQAFFAEHE
jgi:pimeloyl-ACP methyl ester carboxylesterase